uniref:GST N-terminal domain-containing protein n=1 Tax=Acanthochromis polyacanthus TaxID=80966 RepID=A0A3Q1EMS8_9TELE
MAKDMTLMWGSGSAPCWRIQIMLEEKQLQGYNQKLFSFEKLEHKSQEVLDMNPRGQVPTFKCGKHILNESCAACFFLENQYKSQRTKLTPDSPGAQALVYQRMFEAITLYQNIFVYFVSAITLHKLMCLKSLLANRHIVSLLKMCMSVHRLYTAIRYNTETTVR